MIHLIMPMAGNGTRFKSGGYMTIKPLIEVDHIPMFLRAYKSVSEAVDDAHFIIKESDNKLEHFAGELTRLVPEAKIHILKNETRGAAETVAQVLEKMEANDSILVLDCDLEFTSKGFTDFLIFERNSCSGALVTFKSSFERYSFVRLENGYISEIAEKRAISDHAVCGAYFFSQAKKFIEAFKRVKQASGELYISAVIAELIAHGGQFKCFTTDSYRSFGTPQELNSD